MKKLLFLFALGVMSVLAGETNTIFTIDFETSEGYTAGDAVGQNNWAKSWSGAGGNLTISDNAAEAQHGQQYLLCEDINHQTSFDISDKCSESDKLQLSFYALVPSDATEQFYVKLHALGSSGRPYDLEISELQIFANGNAQMAYTTAGNQFHTFSVSGLAAGTYQRVSLIIEPESREIEEISIAGEVLRDEGMFYKSAFTDGCGKLPDGVRLMKTGRLDNFKVETCPAPPKKEFDLNPAKVAFSGETTEAKADVINKGVDSFDFTASVVDAAEWLTVAPASGTCATSAELTLSVDRSVMTDGYYRTAVKIDGGEYGAKNLLVSCPNGTGVFAENFEAPFMHEGDIVGQNNWVPSWSGAGGIIIVSNNTHAAQSGDQFLFCDDADSQYGVNHQTSFDISEQCPGNVKLNVSGYTFISSEAIHPFYTKIHALGASGKPYDLEITEFIRYADGKATLTYSAADGSQKTFEVNDLPVDTYQPFTLTIFPATRAIERMTIGDQVLEGEGMYYKSAKTEGCGTLPDGIRVMHSGAVDNFRIEICPLPPTKEFEVSPAQPIFSRTATEKKLTLVNKTTGSFDFTATVADAPEWLSITPDSGTCEGAVELTMTVDRSIMTNGYYRAMVTIDGGDYGSKTFPVCCPNGTVIYAENFESPYMQIGGIDGQNTWVGDYQHEGNCMLVTNVTYGFEGNCGYIVRSGGHEGYMCDVYSPTGGILKVSMKLYKGSEADKEADYFYIQNDVWYRSVSFWFIRETEKDYFYLYSFGNGPAQKTNLLGGRTFPLDTWLDFSFTVDYRRYLMTDLTLGDFTTNFGTSVELSKKATAWVDQIKRFTKFCVSCGAKSENAMLLIDDLKFEDVPRPDTFEPQLNGVYVFGEDKTTIEDTVVNGGTKPFQYEVSFLDYPENVSVTTGATGVIEESGKLGVSVTRDGLDDGFFRARMRYAYGPVGSETLGNAITSLVTFSKGGWYYVTYFSAPFYTEGDLKGQDYWEVQNKSTSPSVRVRDGRRCVYFPESSFASVPALGPVGSTFTVKAEFLMEKNENTTYVDLTQNGETGFLPIRIRRDKESNEALIGYMSGDDFMEWFRAPLDEWNTLSFTLDTDVAFGCALSASVNGIVTNFAEGEVPLNQGFDDQPLTSVGIKTQNDGPDEMYATGVWFSKLSAHDASIPEPIAVGLLAVALALAMRRR